MIKLELGKKEVKFLKDWLSEDLETELENRNISLSSFKILLKIVLKLRKL
tara:strand:+ start:181 stop:330 length:150 start_codon:yes stop_codon:yes gene_type:complete